MIPKRDKETNIATEVAQGKHLQKRIKQGSEEAAERLMRGDSLNSAIADISKRENFNQLQIQRLVEESNTVAFNKKYDEKKKEKDRRIDFELGELSVVIEKMGTDAPPAVENPNWATGRPGEGEMVKSASFQIHSPNADIDASRQRLRDKQASQRLVELEKKAKDISREMESGIFKIAQTLVMSERYHKNANAIYNTMLSDVSFDDYLAEGIAKKASELTDLMKETNRVHSGFVLSLEVQPEEKVASVLLGSNSLLKTAAGTDLVEPPKVAPVQDINDYSKLIALAKDIQNKQQASLDVEREIHGGVPIVK